MSTKTASTSSSSDATTSKTTSRKRGAKSQDDASDSLALTKAIIAIKKQQESFEKAAMDCRKLVDEHFSDLELKTSAKRKAMEELDEQFEQTKRSKKIDLDNVLKEYGYSEAVKTLQARSEVPISSADLAKLKTDLEFYKKDHSQQLAEVAKSEKDKYEKEMKNYQTVSDLKHQTDLAQKESSIKQLKDHIAVLDNQIKSLQQDVDKQRELTKSVSEASRPQYYPSPSSGRG